MASAEPIPGRCAAVVRPKPDQGREGGYCEKHPLAGQRRCGSHGGNAPQAKAAAERRQQEEEAKAIVARYGVPVHIDWHVAMQESLDETYGCVLALRDLVQQLAPEALVWGTATEVEVGASRFPGVDVTKAAAISPTVDLYGRERDRLFRMAHDCGKLGLEARRDEFAEQYGNRVAELISGILTDFGIDPKSPEAMQVVSTRLYALKETA